MLPEGPLACCLWLDFGFCTFGVIVDHACKVFNAEHRFLLMFGGDVDLVPAMMLIHFLQQGGV